MASAMASGWRMGSSDTIGGLMAGSVSGLANAWSPERSVSERFEREALPHLNDIFRTAGRILGDAARAEDVAQEVYLQAWKSFARFEPGTNCRAWLFRILFHCIHHHRRKWFRFSLLNDVSEFLESNLTAPEPIGELITDGEILAALDRIPVDFRSVVLMVDVEEFSYKEAAEILSIPIGTVMSRLNRGRKLLRDHLRETARGWGIGDRQSDRTTGNIYE
jgi:RNA polymerase sigma-70 factor, ECF subfamily